MGFVPRSGRTIQPLADDVGAGDGAACEAAPPASGSSFGTTSSGSEGFSSVDRQPGASNARRRGSLDQRSETSEASGAERPRAAREAAKAVRLQGTLATSLKDNRYKMGKLFVVAEPNGETNLGIAFSDLQVREIAK